MAEKIGTAFIEVTIDKTKYVAELNNLQRQTKQAVDRTTRDIGKLQSAFGLAATGLRFFAGYLSFQTIKNFAKEINNLALRYETLGVSLKVTGSNIGASTQDIEYAQKSLQKYGISMLGARQTLVRMAQAQIDFSKATNLARIAQDTAVIANKNSSDTFEHLIYGIQSANVRVLRTIGLNVNFERSYIKLAKSLNTTRASLTEYQKTIARTREVEEAGERISGIYEKAMTTAGKQILSMQRYTEDLKVMFYSVFNQLAYNAVFRLVDIMKELNAKLTELTNSGAIQRWGKDLANQFKGSLYIIENLIMLLGQLIALVAQFPHGIVTAFLVGTGALMGGPIGAAIGGALGLMMTTFDAMIERYEDLNDVTVDLTGKQKALADQIRATDEAIMSQKYNGGKFFDPIPEIAEFHRLTQKGFGEDKQAAEDYTKALEKADKAIRQNGMSDYAKSVDDVNQKWEKYIELAKESESFEEARRFQIAKEIELSDLRKKSLESLEDKMKEVNDIILTAGMGKDAQEYQKQLTSINLEYDKLIKNAKELGRDEDALNIERAKSIKLTQLETEQYNKLVDAQIEAGNSVEEFIAKQKDFLTKDQIQMLRDYVEAGAAPEAIKAQIEGLEQIANSAKDASEEQKKLLKDQEDDAKETWRSMADFYRDALTQMGSDTSSFLDMVKSKMKNLAASIVSGMLTNMTMSLMGTLSSLFGSMGPNSMASSTGSSFMNMLGMPTAGKSSGFNMFSALGGAKDIYNLRTGFPSWVSATPVTVPWVMQGGSMMTSAGVVPSFTNFANGLTPGVAQAANVTSGLGATSGAATIGSNVSWLGVGAGALGVAAGGYGMYNAYKQGSVGNGAISGAGAGLGGAALLSAMGVGASMGSWFPVIGTAIGAIVGAIVGMFGKAGAEAKKRRQDRAEDYFEVMQATAEKEYSNLSELFENVDKVSSHKAVYSAIKLGGLEAPGIESLYDVGDTAKAYGDNLKKYGDTAIQTVTSFKDANRQMELFSRISANWTGSAKQVADAWLKAMEKAKKLQIKEITEDFAKGIGTYSTAIAKIEIMGLTDAEEATLRVDFATQALTNNVPVLYGELTKARKVFQEAKYELAQYGDAEEQAAMKAQILASDIKLTESQLRGIKYGKINTDLIALYQALEWTDKEFSIVTTEASKLTDVFDALDSVIATTQQTLANVAEEVRTFKGAEKYTDFYNSAQTALSALSGMIDLMKDLENIPDIVKSMADAFKNVDLSSFATELSKIASIFLDISNITSDIVKNMSGMTEAQVATMTAGGAASGMTTAATGANMAGLQQVALIAGQVGVVLSVLALIAEAIVTVQQGWQRALNIFAKNEETKWIADTWYNIRKSVIDLRKQLNELRIVEPIKLLIETRMDKKLERLYNAVFGEESTDSTLTKIGLNKQLTTSQAVSVYEKYRDNLKYSGMTTGERQIAEIQDEADMATLALQKTVTDAYAEALASGGGISSEEWAQIQELQEGVLAMQQAIREGAAQEIADLQKQAKLQYEATMKPYDTIIRQVGMTDTEKAIDSAMQQYQDAMDALKEQRDNDLITEEMYTEGLGKILKARDITLAELIVQAAEAEAAFQKQFTTIIRQSGMSDFEKQMDNLIEQFREYYRQAELSGYATENLTEAFKIQSKELIDNFWEPVVENIKSSMDSLLYSGFNLAPGVKRASDATTKYNQLKAAMLGATGEDFATKYAEFQAFSQTYLQEMQNTYLSSQPYLDAFQDVMDTLQTAQDRANQEWTNTYSQYENANLSKQEELKSALERYIEKFDVYATESKNGFAAIVEAIGRINLNGGSSTSPPATSRSEPTNSGYEPGYSGGDAPGSTRVFPNGQTYVLGIDGKWRPYTSSSGGGGNGSGGGSSVHDITGDYLPFG